MTVPLRGAIRRPVGLPLFSQPTNGVEARHAAPRRAPVTTRARRRPPSVDWRSSQPCALRPPSNSVRRWRPTGVGSTSGQQELGRAIVLELIESAMADG